MSTANELRELQVQELRGRVAELKKQLFDLKSKHNTGVLDSTAELASTRREIARVLTVARQKELGVDRAAKVSAAATPAPKKAKAEKPAKKAGKAKE